MTDLMNGLYEYCVGKLDVRAEDEGRSKLEQASERWEDVWERMEAEGREEIEEMLELYREYWIYRERRLFAEGVRLGVRLARETSV